MTGQLGGTQSKSGRAPRIMHSPILNGSNSENGISLHKISNNIIAYEYTSIFAS